MRRTPSLALESQAPSSSSSLTSNRACSSSTGTWLPLARAGRREPGLQDCRLWPFSGEVYVKKTMGESQSSPSGRATIPASQNLLNSPVSLPAPQTLSLPGRLPVRWMAIESLNYSVYTTKSDV